jgi:hypothetical protein
MHIVPADPAGRALTEAELRAFLTEPHNLRLGMVSEDGWPIVHPVWFWFEDEKLWTTIARDSLKARLIERSPKTYFTIDTDGPKDIRGVRGKAQARIHDDIPRTVDIATKQLIKYLGSTEGWMAELLLKDAAEGQTRTLELTPLKYVAWTY